jgi:hypothetical protein
MSPMAVNASSLRIHQTAIVRIVKPIRSDGIGKMVRLKTIGEKIEFRTPKALLKGLLRRLRGF